MDRSLLFTHQDVLKLVTFAFDKGKPGKEFRKCTVVASADCVHSGIYNMRRNLYTQAFLFFFASASPPSFFYQSTILISCCTKELWCS